MSEEKRSDEACAEAQALWAELGKHEAAYPTPEQLLTFMRRCSDAAGVDLAERILRWNDAATRCFEHGHDGLLSELRATQEALSEASRKLDAVDTWLANDCPTDAEAAS